MINKLRHNKSITLITLNELCNMFECDITDIIEYTTVKNTLDDEDIL